MARGHNFRDEHYLLDRCQHLARDLARQDTDDSPETILETVYSIPVAALDQILRLALATCDYKDPRLVSIFDSIYCDTKSKKVQDEINTAVGGY